MKKSILIASTLMLSILATAQTTDIMPMKQKYSGLIKFHPVNFIWSEFMIGGEAALSRKHAIALNFGATVSGKSDFYNAENVFGYGADGQFKIYLTGRNILDGFYVAPYAFYRTIELDKSIYKEIIDINGYYSYEYVLERMNASTYGGGVSIGYQLIINNTISFDVYAGGGLKVSRDSAPEPDPINQGWYYNEYSIVGFRNTGASPRLGLSIGIAL